MKNSEEITLFGHRLPKKVYEDYKSLEKLKDVINELLDNSVNLNEAEKTEIRKTFSSISETFNEMELNRPRPPCMRG